MQIVLFSTDTPHHRYFINKLLTAGINFSRIYFETKHVTPSFTTGPFLEEEEKRFENDNFFADIRADIDCTNVRIVKSINDKFVVKDLDSIGASFGVVFGTGIIKEHIINNFSDGLVNVHRGISQLYRGLDSDLWAIYHKDYENIGVTVHMVDKYLDTGSIVEQERLAIKKDMKLFQLRYYTSIIATNLVKSIIEKYRSTGNVGEMYKQPRGRYYSFMPLDIKYIVEKNLNRYCSGLTDTKEYDYKRLVLEINDIALKHDGYSDLTVITVAAHDVDSRLLHYMIRSVFKFTDVPPRVIICDNGRNGPLAKMYDGNKYISIVKNPNLHKNASMSHGIGLNKAFSLVKTVRTAVIESDCVILNRDWNDTKGYLMSGAIKTKFLDKFGFRAYYPLFLVFYTDVMRKNGCIDFKPDAGSRRTV